jgi:site-specific DNA-methyltransferase (adenine-specific)
MASVEFTREDCLDLLRSLQDDSVDLVLTDPPYFIGYEGQGWDNQWRDEAAYLDWCRRWTAECARVLKPGRMLIVWGTLKTDTFLRYKLDVLNSFPELTGQNEIIWSYNWGGRSKANFARKHEYAWCYSKGERFLFHGDDVRVPRKMDKNMRTGGLHTTGMIPTSVWEVNNHTNSKDFVNWHPTTKNLAVLDRMIRAYTNPGDTVLDPFMGSASTAIAALRADRNAIGCERSVFYFSKASARIEAEEARLSLLGTTPGTGSS